MEILWDKEWYLSKTMWTAIVMALFAIYTAYTGQPIPEFIYPLLGAIGLVGIRQAVGRIDY